VLLFSAVGKRTPFIRAPDRTALCSLPRGWELAAAYALGSFFKLAGYTPGKALFDAGEGGIQYVPVGILGQAGLTWAAQPNDSQGQPVVTQNGAPEFYGVTAELGTRLTDWAGIFAGYGVSNNFPGWKSASGPTDIRVIHFFHPGDHELLVGIDSNNDPTLQDVWNTAPRWAYPFYGSPQARPVRPLVR
jgi:hypothetical protein